MAILIFELEKKVAEFFKFKKIWTIANLLIRKFNRARGCKSYFKVKLISLNKNYTSCTKITLSQMHTCYVNSFVNRV